MSGRLHRKSALYRLLERLLELGADPSTVDGLDEYPLMTLMQHFKVDLATVKLPLDHGHRRGVDLINARVREGPTFLHRMVSSGKVDLLREMFTHLPHYTSTIDDSLKTKNWTNGEMESLVPYAASMSEKAFDEECKQRVAAISTLLMLERGKQYTTIRSLLTQYTPLKLNNANDLTTVVLSCCR